MNPLELWHLRRLCDKHELDYQEIDSGLTYWENKKHLLSLVTDCEADLDEWKAQKRKFFKNHILEDYIGATEEGRTKSEEVGKPVTFRFSLRQFVRRHEDG